MHIANRIYMHHHLCTSVCEPFTLILAHQTLRRLASNHRPSTDRPARGRRPTACARDAFAQAATAARGASSRFANSIGQPAGNRTDSAVQVYGPGCDVGGERGAKGAVSGCAEGTWRPAQRCPGWASLDMICRCGVCGRVGVLACVKLPHGEFTANKSRARAHTHTHTCRPCVEPCLQRRGSTPRRQHKGPAIRHLPQANDISRCGCQASSPASRSAFSTGLGAAAPTRGGFRPAKGRFGLNTAGFRVGQHRAGSGQLQPISNTPKPGFGRGKLGPARPGQTAGPAGGTAGPCGQAGPRALRGQRRPERRVASTPVVSVSAAGAAAATKHGALLHHVCAKVHKHLFCITFVLFAPCLCNMVLFCTPVALTIAARASTVIQMPWTRKQLKT